MALPEGHKKNFETLVKAAKADNLALLECLDAETGESVAVLCALNREAKGDGEFVPFASMLSEVQLKSLVSPMGKDMYDALLKLDQQKWLAEAPNGVLKLELKRITDEFERTQVINPELGMLCFRINRTLMDRRDG